MPYFCIHDHPQMPLVRVSITDRRQDVDKFGFRLRYVLKIDGSATSHADDVIDMIDGSMGARTKAHGVYQATYDEVRAAYGDLLASAPPVPWNPTDLVVRGLSLTLGVTVGLATCAIMPWVVLAFLLVTALKRQSGFAAMAEAHILWWIFDWRPIAIRLIRHALRKNT